MTDRVIHGTADRLQLISKLLKDDDVRNAITQCQVLLREFPDNPDALGLLGLGYLRQDNLPGAEQALSRALRVAPADATLLNALGIVRMKQGLHVEAIRLFSGTLEKRPNDSDALSNLAATFTALQQPHRAAAYLERLTQVLPFSVHAYKRASDNRLSLGDVEQAIRYGRQAVRLAPGNAMGRLSLADALEAGGRFRQAKFQYLAVLENDADQSTALSGLLSLKNTSVAERHVTSAKRLLDGVGLHDPDRVQLQLAMAQYFDQRGLYATAFEHLNHGNAIRFRNHAFDSRAHSQAIDQLILACTGSTLAAIPTHEVRSNRPIFIVGMPRSGTTLVEQILASHPQVAAGGELPAIINIAGQIGRNSTKYPEAMQGIDRETLARMARQYLDTLDTISPDSARVTDKMPFNYMHLALIVALFPDATIIHCRRNALDNCLSCYFTSFNEQLQFASELRALGHYWLDYQRLVQHWNLVLPIRILEVQYELLVANTEECIREMLGFCNLAWDPACLHFYLSARGVRTPSRWQVRQPIYDRSVGRWRNYEQQLKPLVEVLSSALHDESYLGAF